MSNQLAEDLGINQLDPMAGKFVESVERRAKEEDERRRSRMSSAEVLALPELLERRRQEYMIPDGAFEVQAAFDRVLFWQVSDAKKKWTETDLVLPDNAKAREAIEAPRGVVLSAGLGALDALRSHGMDVGHIVRFLHLAPYAIRCDTIRGKDYFVRVIDVGDIVGSEDIVGELREGKVRIGQTYAADESGETGRTHYYYRDTDTVSGLVPQRVLSKEDY